MRLLNWEINRRKSDPVTESDTKMAVAPRPETERQKANQFDFEYENLPSYVLNTYNYGQNGGMSYNTDSLLLLYKTVPQLSSIVNYVASKAADIPIRHYRYMANGKKRDLGETDVIKLIQSPNKTDSETSFRQDAIASFMIFGNVAQKIIRTPGFAVPSELHNEPANRIWRIPQFPIDQYGRPDTSKDHINNPIVKYRKQLDNGVLNDIDIRDMIYIRDINPSKTGMDYYYGMSKVYAATRTISVLGNLYDAINTILANKGALGFLKRNARNNEIDASMYLDQVEEFEKRFLAKYGVGVGKQAIMATCADLSFEKMTVPISDFQPVELTSQEFDTLCNQMYGFPSPLLNSKANSTYNNLTEMIKMLYINTIQPINANYFNGLSDQLGLSKVKEWIEPDYSGIEALQQSRKEMAEGVGAQVNYLEILRKNGYISKNKVLTEIGYEPVNDQSFNTIENDQSGGEDKGIQG